jgi:hypothetical protein
MITKNEGPIDRGVRIVVGLALLSQVVWGAQTPIGYIGLIPLITGIVGVCPGYMLFGLSTCPISKVMGKKS